ncbi:MAG TPA: HSP20 family small heat-shock protein [Holophagaceae bacterium]|nr:HSP20 family small heat-shock protein [Holophagaceae bacterium]
MANLLIRRPSSLLSEEADPFASMKGLLAWDPFQELRRMDPFRLLRGASPEGLQELVPALEVKETPTAFEVRMDVPGLKESDLDVSLSGNRLCISGKREAEEKEETDTYHAYERSYGAFNRTFSLPEDIDANKIKAELKDGVLALSVPKLPEARAKKIEITGR